MYLFTKRELYNGKKIKMLSIYFWKRHGILFSKITGEKTEIELF